MNLLNSILVLLLAWVLPPSVSAQKDPIKFGKIDEKDLAMKVYDKDSAASAIILCDYGNTTLEYSAVKSDFEMTYERHVRIKIFKADAEVLERLVNIEISFTKQINSTKEDIAGIRAVSYELENGKVKETKMDKSSIFEKELYKNNFVKKFTLPNVKDGVVIEYQYTITSDFFFRPRIWYFQDFFPTVHSEYRFSFPEYYSYAFNQEGYHHLSINENEVSSKTIHFMDRVTTDNVSGQSEMRTSSINMNTTNYRWAMKDLPALRNEVYITTAKDYFDKMEFQLDAVKWPNRPIRLFNDSWKTFSKDLLDDDDIGGKLKKRGAVNDLVKTILKDISDPKEKVFAIANYVKNNINVKTEGLVVSDRSHKKVLEEKVGAIGDVNLLMGAMLIEAGFKAKPVLLSTRSHGRVSQTYPILSRFNYIIMQVQVDTNLILVDAADPFLPVGVLPFELLNGQGLLLDENNPTWLNLQAAKTVDYVLAEVSVEKNKIIKGIIQTTQKSYEGLKLRKNINEQGEEKATKAFLEKLVGNGSLTSEKFENVKNPYENLKGKFEFATSEFLEANSEHIYFSPMMSFGYNTNPLKKQDRIYPIDFAHPSDRFYNLNFTIPEGYVVEELPKAAKIQWQDGSVMYQYLVDTEGTKGMIKISSKIQFKKPVFSAQEYEDLKKTFDAIIAKQSEQIVLKKK